MGCSTAIGPALPSATLSLPSVIWRSNRAPKKRLHARARTVHQPPKLNALHGPVTNALPATLVLSATARGADRSITAAVLQQVDQHLLLLQVVEVGRLILLVVALQQVDQHHPAIPTKTVLKDVMKLVQIQKRLVH